VPQPVGGQFLEDQQQSLDVRVVGVTTAGGISEPSRRCRRNSVTSARVPGCPSQTPRESTGPAGNGRRWLHIASFMDLSRVELTPPGPLSLLTGDDRDRKSSGT
jgi:hypothetical protein